MKRSPMPPRSKPMDRGRPPNRTSTLARRTPLRFRSKKAAAIAPKRASLVAVVLDERPWCEARVKGHCTGRSIDVHEPCRRSQGGDILAVEEVLSVCRGCHDWITTHPLAAEALELAEWGWAYRQRKATS